MYILIYMYTYIYIYMCTYAYIYMYLYMYLYVYVYMSRIIYIYVFIYFSNNPELCVVCVHQKQNSMGKEKRVGLEYVQEDGKRQGVSRANLSICTMA